MLTWKTLKTHYYTMLYTISIYINICVCIPSAMVMIIYVKKFSHHNKCLKHNFGDHEVGICLLFSAPPSEFGLSWTSYSEPKEPMTEITESKFRFFVYP